MFCPECGQQQVSDEVRFCSRCGFQLAGVTGLLATRGALPVGAAMAVPAAETPKRKGVRQGAKVLLFGIFLMPVFGILGGVFGGHNGDEAAIVGLIVVLAGFLRMIYAALFEDGPYRKQPMLAPHYVPPAAPPLAAQARGAELPPAHGVTAQGYASPRTNTAEISFRPSVTEHDTQLLDEQRDKSAR
jgi:zinc-ribbon domain